MKTAILMVMSLILISCIGSDKPSLVKHELEAGVGVVDITGENAVILDPLQVKAVVFRQGDTQIALVACDAIGVSENITKPVREKASQMTGIPVENICIAATHTHMDNPRKDLEPAILQAISQAQANLKPVTLESALGQQFDISFHRRYFMKDGSVVFNPMFLNPDIVRPVGSIDPEVNFLMIKDNASHSPVASLTSFALHLDIVKEYGAVYQKDGAGSRDAVSADYPYWLETFLQEDYGDNFNSIFFTGACGNINHWDFSKPGPQSGHKTKSREVGDSLYKSIKRALGEAKIEEPLLASRSRIIDIPLQSFSDEDLKWAQNINTVQLSGKSEEPNEREQFLNDVKRRRILWLNQEKERGHISLPMEVQAFRLSNNSAIVTLPGEIFVELGLTIKNHSPFENTFVVELANNSIAYVPNKKAFAHGGYEVENSRLIPGGGEMMVAVAIELLKELKDEVR
jgi:neutral ceramidase